MSEDKFTGCKAGALVIIEKLKKQDKKTINHSVTELVAGLCEGSYHREDGGGARVQEGGHMSQSSL